MHPTKEIIDSWPAPNYVDPITRGPALTVINIVFIILVFLVVGLRYYTRLRITHSFGLDDMVIGASVVPTLALTIVVLIADNNFGWNRHSWDLHAENGPSGYKLCLAAQVLFFWAATLNKISLLCFFKRLTGPCTPLWYRWTIVAGLGFLIGMLIAFFISALFACRPLSAFWSPLATYAHTCIDEGEYMLCFSVITILLDFFLLLLPLPIIRSLQLSSKQRVAVCGLFFIGFIVCISGIIHAYYVDLALVKSYDETWDGWPLWVASAIQVDVGILCVSVPAIRPLLAIYIPKLLESSRPPVRDLNEVYDPNKLTDVSGSSSAAVKTPAGNSEKSGSDYFAPELKTKRDDLERGESRHTKEEDVSLDAHP